MAGWLGTDRLERDNDFCNACHLDSGAALHLGQRRDFDVGLTREPTSLAAAHARAGFARLDREAGGKVAANASSARQIEREFRCIDCHGGVGLIGRARVKALAAKDSVVWLFGDFEEPEGMNWPLVENDCRQCHAAFAAKAGPFEDPAFHDLAVHNVELGVGCVECHSVHTGDPGDPEHRVDPKRWFLNTAHVRTQCARCHREFQEGTGT